MTSRCKTGFFVLKGIDILHRMEPEYEACHICPRNCGVNRNNGEKGICGETAEIRIAWAGLHFGEEPPITGKGGSGTIFITGCNLRCKFCQNYQISQCGMGRSTSIEEFADICHALETAGAENINIVTGSHAVPTIATALRCSKEKGLSIPILWNSSAYEIPETLERLDGLVDVWLPDIKTLNPLLSEATFQASDYPKVAKKAIRHMIDRHPLIITHPDDTAYPEGKIMSGVIVRHLALPGRLPDTELVLQWFSEHIADRALFSLMTQYTPVPKNPQARNLDAFPDRLLKQDEFNILTEMLEKYEINTGFYQELVEDTEWLPDFSLRQPFSSALAKPVWHWREGFLYPRN